MTSTLVHRIYTIASVVTLSAIYMAVALLLNPMFEGVAPAHEMVGSWGGYGELPPLW
jgi:hypothetical protein